MEIMPKLISQYLASGEYVRKLSPNTLKAYRIDLLQFSEFVGGEWPSSNELNEYIKYLNQISFEDFYFLFHHEDNL